MVWRNSNTATGLINPVRTSNQTVLFVIEIKDAIHFVPTIPLLANFNNRGGNRNQGDSITLLLMDEIVLCMQPTETHLDRRLKRNRIKQAQDCGFYTR